MAGRAHLRNEIRQLRRVAVEFAQDRRDRPDKHPGVPAEIAFLHKGVGQLGVRLFAETQDAKDVVRRAPSRQGDRRALFDVTEARTGPGRLDPDRDERARFLRGARRGLHRLLKCGPILDHVICRQDQHRGAMIAHRHPGRGERDRRRGVALRRFRYDIFRRKIRQQSAHGRFLIDVRQDQNPFRRDQSVESIDRFFEQRLVRNQRQTTVSVGRAGSAARSVRRCRQRG